MGAHSRLSDARLYALGWLCLGASAAWLSAVFVFGYKSLPPWGLAAILIHAAAALGAVKPDAALALSSAPAALLVILVVKGLYVAFPAAPSLILLSASALLLDGGRRETRATTRISAVTALVGGIILIAVYAYHHRPDPRRAHADRVGLARPH